MRSVKGKKEATKERSLPPLLSFPLGSVNYLFAPCIIPHTVGAVATKSLQICKICTNLKHMRTNTHARTQ